MTHLTTHILDAVRGVPGTGVAVALTRHLPAGGTEAVADGVTDADGRLALGPDLLEPGVYAISFATGAFFADQGVESFYPLVTVNFTVSDERHYHVPLLLSPFAYSTYRGS
ncbi:hydroxyisourate hydrolase [Microbacterium sp. cx-55]|uniref:hydroxyisourate hydrolase n=1 Tax=unclassified Microbacterium TaxID=2609290 RepID=UPI001CC009E9|nr:MULTISPECIES: hydroxyisourate hydrolase [unclassified Microbacterium]MBZ4487296.1 hydroxyisourate hydrolase [Microbacterium sp. cx-55]MCC4908587.1 hydroxyisourate hydrolase [Microbacterium sp. cx-59]UGB35318.1 hydroxyisourate hydrolase [Microbacterium sp. cx-55]